MDQDKKEGEGVCMACDCPCDVHTKHTHGDMDKKTCVDCGHEHKSDGTCDCECK